MSFVSAQNNLINQSDYYFDQKTGVMVEWHQQYIQNSGNLQTNSTQLVRLISSSVWAVPELTALAVIPFICAMAVLVLCIRKKVP